uniref:Protein kinase domain-containing protein n=1 Tax=Setaria viridis TaxID=4556 RepID=A0A4V6D6N2_SETVI|nr:hypothetical protein SEVIR_5G207300v2 [Setaria viridis]
MRIQSLLVFLTAVLLSSSTPTAGNDDDGVTAEVTLLCYSCRGDCGRVGGRILGPRCNLRYEKELIFRENYGTLQIDLPKGKILSTVAIALITGSIVFILCLVLTGGVIQRIKGGKLQRELGDWHNEVTRTIVSRFSLCQSPIFRVTKANFQEDNRLGHGSFSLVSRPTLLLVIVTALPLSTTAVAAECDRLEEMTTRVNPLYYDCGCSKYNRSDSYHNDLGILAGKLRSNISASDSNFFAFANVGSVYGFVLCRGDYKGPQCANSLNQTIQDAVLNPFICPFYKDVTIYSDQHMLSFSGDQYLIYKDDRPAWVASNMNYVKNGTASDGVSYGERVEELLNRTADYAAFNSSDLYATGESWFGEGGVSMVYGLVQCRPDLKRELCRQCLAELISSIPKQFTTNSGDHRVGGRILGVRCNLRFEKDLFFKETNETSKLHMPKSRLSKVNITLITIAGFVILVLCLNLIGGIIQRIRDRKLQRELGDWHNEVTREIDSRFSLYHFPVVRDATGNFSEENKLGRGSFGFVYRGILPDGVEIAVKRLDASSWQGSSEFLNEIKLIVKLQHANLVRLLGCCLQHSEMILVYEYMPNRSLDYVFSDPASRDSLNWSNRLRVIDGIAQGLVYLHNFSEPQKFIIHRDMKLSNILLDSEMNPKISDFGIARIYDLGPVEPEPTDVVGTRGYMAPEYMRERMLSVKYDVFSFGVLLLEIISGRRVNAAVFTEYGRSDHLLTHAWYIWHYERYNQLVDPSLRGVYQMLELRRRIQIALLCVQENPDHRPHMREVTTMLSNNDDGGSSLPALEAMYDMNHHGHLLIDRHEELTPLRSRVHFPLR